MVKDMGRLWTNKDLNGIPVPVVNCGPDIPHFHDLPEKDRMAVLCWLLLNIRPAKPGKPGATGVLLHGHPAEQHTGAGGFIAPRRRPLGC